jgi:hypothetical protein
MKLSHAAALALVGWYLMMAPANKPPPSDANKSTPNLTAPLPQWVIVGRFDHPGDCKAAAWDHLKSFAIGSPWKDSLQCIATDDPRIKPKRATAATPAIKYLHPGTN